MNVGSIGYDCHSGLAHLLRAFHREGVVNRVLIVPHRHYRRHPEWYPDAFSIRTADQFLDGLDVLLLFENAWHWSVAKEAKEKGIRIILIPNYEYTPHPIPVEPDLVLCASLLDVDLYSERYKTAFLPIPAEGGTWRKRTKAVEFIHNAGHGQHDYAKGTPEILEAMRLVKSPVRLLCRGQPGERRIRELFQKNRDMPNVEFVLDDVPDGELYARGDVFLYAEQYNGMSLPLQEAHAAGMLVMTTNRYPANTWLPNDPLIPVKGYRRYRVGSGYLEFDRAIIDPVDIAATIDTWYGQDISLLSMAGKQWAERCSWENLKPLYMETLKG